MAKKLNVNNRAWDILRMALLWGRKGGVFKRRLMMELRVVPKFLKNLAHNNKDQIHYGERQLSFDDTPIFHVKMHRPASLRFHLPHIPCINPQVDFDYDFSEDGDNAYYSYDDGRTSFLRNGEEEDEQRGEEYGCNQETKVPSEEIDLQAEEFIAKFYEQMKLQRQISYLQYTETKQSNELNQ